MHLQDANENQGRCFTMSKCNESSSCEASNQTVSLTELKEKCLKDEKCIAVSCDVNPSDTNVCNRHMLSSSCNDSTIEDNSGWTYHILDSSKTLLCLSILQT